MFPLRNVLNAIQVWLRLAELQEQQKSFHPDDFDLGSLPLKSPNYKASPGWRDAGELDMITVHVTAVKNGFGVSKSAVKRWAKQQDSDGFVYFSLKLVPLARGLVDAGVFRETGHYDSRKGYQFLMLDDPQRIAKRFALWERFRNVPYHMIATRAGDVLYNRRLEQRSWHGNGGNAGAGLALDMHPSEAPGDDFAATGRHALTMLADRLAFKRGDRAPIVVKVVSHRQHKHPGRATDPGEWASKNVVVPVVDRRTDLVLAHGLTTGSGKPWPNKWDPESPYDMKGNRIDGR